MKKKRGEGERKEGRER